MELPIKKTGQSNGFPHIKTIDQFIQNRELFQKFLSIVGDFKATKTGHRYSYSIDEQNNDLINLLFNLKIIDYALEEPDQQAQKTAENKVIEFSFNGDKIITLRNRVLGKGGRIKKETLELIARDIGDRLTFNKIVEIFVDTGVPETMFIQDAKWRAVFYVLSYYTTSSLADDFKQFLEIIEKVIHPLYFNGNEVTAEETKKKYNTWLKYDDINIDVDTGVIYAHQTNEDNLSGEGWYNSNGEAYDKEGDISNIPYSKALYLLRIYTNQIYNALSAVASGQKIFIDTELNTHYILLILNFNKILNRTDFKELKKLVPRLIPEHLFQYNVDEMDVWWDNEGQHSIIGFSGDIESVWVKDGQQVFTVSASTSEEFRKTAEAITKLKKYKEARWNHTMKNIHRIRLEERKQEEEKEASLNTKENTKTPPKKIIHEHHFMNSIQEKEIALNYKQEKSGTTGFYIIKKDDNFFYKGRFLNLSKKSDYYRVFCSLFAKCPEGGEITYQELISEVKSRIPKTKLKTDEQITKFIQDNLTGNKNGFLRYSGTTETEDNGKPLISINRGLGVVFNNKAG